MQNLLKSTTLTEIANTTHSRKVSVFGLNLGERALLSSMLGPICYVSADGDVETLAREFSSLGRKVAVLDNSTDDFCLHILEFGGVGLNAQSALFSAINHDIDTLIVSPEALIAHYVPREIWAQNTIKIEVNADIDPEALSAKLVEIGYKRVDNVEEAGQWARRGDIVDIFPLNSPLPYRIHFFDTQIEKITTFNALTQYSIDKATSVTICPNGFRFPENLTAEAVESLDAQKTVMQRRAGKAKNPADFLGNLEAIDHAKSLLNSGFPREAWQYLCCCLPSVSLVELLGDFTFVFDQPKPIFSAIQQHTEVCKTNIDEGIASGQLCLLHKNCVPDFEALCEDIKKVPAISFQSFMTQNRFFNPEAVFNLDTLPVPKLGRSYEDYATSLNEFLNNGYTVILTANDATQGADIAEKLGRYIRTNEIASTLDARKNVVNIFVHPLLLGACLVKDKILLLGNRDSHFIKPKAKWDKNIVKVTDTFTLPEQGDYVVHAIHGIGVCEGVTQLSIGGAKRDYIVVSYKNNDRLYVPTEQVDMLGRYIGGDKAPALSSLGGNSFEKVKQRVRESVKQLAFDLLKLYREREKSKGIVMQVDASTLAEFEASFKYTPTPDQEKAFNDVYHDLSSGKIMDRLIVGDVGYGKTEVALRSAFVAVMSGYQVAVIVPTTILSEQHFNTFKARLQNYGINVRCLNRFRTAKEQREIIEEVKSGKANILIGTHRALSKDVEFDNLGLLILDEEQRFGVGDKEKLKNIKKNVHVLTLSATPIPRTLHMSLVGIRDITTIETPPLERLPVQTIVSQFSYNLAGTALRREKARGGQSLVVYPRVENIESFANSLRAELGPEFTVAVAHGQMDKNAIEDVMLAVYRGDVDVLVATTLIENGIDVPNANTLFVVSAEKLGLSQLYQLRGRVGRSDRLAYAYFTYMDEGKLTGNAYERLSVLMQYTALGSGFKIAMRDLEIRGAGNILGPEQHGQMEKVGYDMYCKILDSSIAELKGIPTYEPQPVKIEVDTDAFIPNDFITDKAQRMEVYSAIANITSSSDYERVRALIEDKYGSVPKAIEGLLNVALLKAKCQSLGAVRASVTREHSNIYFADAENLSIRLEKLKGRHPDVINKDNMAILKLDNHNLDISGIWTRTFAILDNLL